MTHQGKSMHHRGDAYEFYCCYYNAITFRVISKFWWGKCGANVKNKIAYALICNNIGNFLGDSVGIQTQNLLIRSQMLYSVELRNHPVLMSHIKFDVAKVLNNFIIST